MCNSLSCGTSAIAIAYSLTVCFRHALFQDNRQYILESWIGWGECCCHVLLLLLVVLLVVLVMSNFMIP